MIINQRLLTKNNCYIANHKINPSGFMVHSTAMPGFNAEWFLKNWNVPKPSGNVCVHGFIDDTGIYQTLPWGIEGWHSGDREVGNTGHGDGISANTLGYIGVEICEPKDYCDVNYFNVTKNYMIELVAHLCKFYGIPVNNQKVIAHFEGYQLWIAGNHADIKHWWVQYFGYTMDMFRQDVINKMKEEIPVEIRKYNAKTKKYEVVGDTIPETTKPVTPSTPVISKSVETINPNHYLINVIADNGVNVRKGPGVNYDIVTAIEKSNVPYTIVEVTPDGRWGKLKSGTGWIWLSATKKI